MLRLCVQMQGINNSCDPGAASDGSRLVTYQTSLASVPLCDARVRVCPMHPFCSWVPCASLPAYVYAHASVLFMGPLCVFASYYNVSSLVFVFFVGVFLSFLFVLSRWSLI